MRSITSNGMDEQKHDQLLGREDAGSTPNTHSSQSFVTINWSKFDWSKFILPGSILIAALLISGSVIMTRGGGGQLNNNGTPAPGAKVNVSADDDPYLGNKNAKVTIIEFSDFQCPFCRSFWKDTLPQIKSEYIDTGKVKFVYRDYPLPFHPMAMPYALGANCANDQGKYWEMHDKIFAEQEKLGSGTISTLNAKDIKKWAAQLGLNANQFNQCLDSEKYKDEIAKDMADGSKVGVTGTPAFFINGQLIVGAQPYATFKALIDSELK